MAIVEYTGAVNQIRGKLNGSVFNKSKSSFTLQRKQSPKKAVSSIQSQRRASFGNVQRSYKLISLSEQAIATQTAVNNPVFDRLGNLSVLSGYNQWVKANLVRSQVSLPILNELDPSLALPFAYDLEFVELRFSDFSPTQRSVEIDMFAVSQAPIGEELYAIWSLGLPVSPGVSSYNQGFVLGGYDIVSVDSSPNPPFSVTELVVLDAEYPVPFEDQYIFLRVDFWRVSSGSLVNSELFRVKPIFIE